MMQRMVSAGWFLLAVSCTVAAVTVAAFMGASVGQDSGPFPPRGSLLERCSALRIDLSLGRVVATNLRLGANRNFSAEHRDKSRTEILTTTVMATTPMVHYERHEDGRVMVWDITADTATLRCRTEEPVAREMLTLRQPARGSLSLRIARSERRGDEQQFEEFQAASLWHLLFALTESQRAPLLEMFETVQPSWRIGAVFPAIEAGLIDAAENVRLPDRAQVEALIKELASAEFRRRQAADRQLRELGPGVEPLLAARAEQVTDREQRERIQAIREVLVKQVPDSPERVVAWLITDREIWLQFLQHATPQRRHLARVQLLRLCDFNWEFDPFADESVRSTQVARLRKRLDVR